ncbi:MAG: hypothetical protein AWM53_00840 [Candidatus Dichloromethanomonas elyunquensis]|nr:MAG: hypothetical protein AWM53_00840 [Candidatus Dichloromethanomonas elyunquensis]
MRDRKKKIIVVDKKYIGLLVIPLVVLAKIIRYTVMDKLIDNASGIRILQMVLFPGHYPNGLTDEGTFWIAASIFRVINILHLSTTFQWEIYITVIFNMLCMIFIAKGKNKIELRQSVFLLFSIGLLNIFVFLMGKDIIQFVLFLMIYLFLSIKSLTYKKKIAVSSIILLLCGVLYRSYFLLIAALLILMVIWHKKVIKKPKITSSLILKTIIIFYLVHGFVLQGSYYLFPEMANQVMTIRSITLYRLEIFGTYPASAILEWWPSSNVPMFLANHFIITLRMLIPIELAALGVKYIPFIIYQLIVTSNLFRALKTVRENSNTGNLAGYIYFAFILGSAVFEPDYGSWVRHEAAAFPMMYYVIDSNDNRDQHKTDLTTDLSNTPRTGGSLYGE